MICFIFIHYISDEDGYIYFREFLYSSMKGYFRDENFFDNLSEDAEKLLDNKEKKFFSRLRAVTMRLYFKY